MSTLKGSVFFVRRVACEYSDEAATRILQFREKLPAMFNSYFWRRVLRRVIVVIECLASVGLGRPPVWIAEIHRAHLSGVNIVATAPAPACANVAATAAVATAAIIEFEQA